MGEALKGPIHFIGIGGTGMSGLAELALRRGYQVQGTDLKSSAMLTRLQALGARVSLGHAASAIGTAATVVYSSAIAASNDERRAADASGVAVLHRSQFLAALMGGHQAVTIAGTHGKSTTSAMIAHVLDSLGLDPTVAIGGTMLRYDSTSRHGGSQLFVAEADESDGSFLNYTPFIGVVTNIAPDHMEYFRDEAGLIAGFRSYLGRIDADGTAIIGWDSPLARQVGQDYDRPRLTYGFTIGSDIRAVNYLCRSGTSTFTAVVERDQLPVSLPTIGKHNVQNALCALAVVRALGLDVAAAASALASFQGVARRMTTLFQNETVLVLDDYAHNPGKIAAAITSLKEAWPDHTLHVVYQAHRFSRLETMYDEMIGAVAAADQVHVVPVYAAGEASIADFSPERLARDITRLFSAKAHACVSLGAAAESVLANLRGPSVILTVGAGDVHLVATQLREKLTESK